ncbi:MAG: hypothetical protein O7A69_02155 [SAR324 cluster bacterium]|nr:hypothetical protein [SAR324 cluster bacterium]
MGTQQEESRSYFTTLQDEDAEFDGDRFLTEVGSQFESDVIMQEVRWRIGVLKEISSQPELAEVSDGLRDRLTQIFTGGSAEEEVLDKLKQLTEITGSDGKAVELRRFVKRNKRTLNEYEYRNILSKKIENTEFQMVNLMAFFPDAEAELNNLTKQLRELIEKIGDHSVPITAIKAQEDNIRNSDPFTAYEQLKLRFLREWLGQFSDLNADELANLSTEDIQQLVVEHQRHQMTHLLKSKITLNSSDMTEYLGLHDTLEGRFTEDDFWNNSSDAARSGFRQLVLTVIQSFGVLKGQRYAFFQSDEDKDSYLLFGVGIADMGGNDDGTVELVPYMKPFTRKSGFLLEIRKRDLGDPDQYYHELRHYVLPFLFAFDHIQNFNVDKGLISFFTSNY